MTTYKQTIKEKSRRSIWEHAVSSLTTNRSDSRILDKAYLKNLAGYVERNSGWSINLLEFQNYLQFLDVVYGKKTPEELKVAFHCGPEPENDVEVLLSLGVRLENMFAFEKEKNEFGKAVSSLRGKYPQLKIFNGTRIRGTGNNYGSRLMVHG